MIPELVSQILDAGLDAVIVVNAEGEIVLANRAAELMYGYDRGELNGRSLEILVPARLRDAHIVHRQHYFETPRSRPIISALELKGLRKDGSEFEAEIALTPIETAEGLLVCSIIRDISGDKYSESYFRNVLESAPDAVIIIDHAGSIAVINQQAEKMFGYSRTELLGKKIEVLIPAHIRDKHVGHRERYVAKPQLRPMGTGLDLRGLRRDGTEFPVEISLSPFATASGAFVSSVIRDVTNRKEMERELISARHQAERASKANTAFLAAASHDLRQPVQALNLLTGALRRTVAADELALEMVESQQASLDAMTNLLNSLLDISRLDAGKIAPEIQDFKVQRLFENLSAESSRQARNKALFFTTGDCEDLTVRSDPNLLSEIIQNLVGNAIRYTDRGGINLSCRTEGEYAWVEVADTGIGIDASQFEEIFREFHQIKAPGREKEGFGLGLAIVKRLADLLEHRIHVASEKGRGSTFSVRIPRVAHVGNPVVEPQVTHSDSLEHGKRGTVLLVEDDVPIARAWGLLLRVEGFRVMVTASVAEVEQTIKKLRSAPDVIISDYHLQDGSNGIDAIATIRSHFARNIPALIVTGDTSKLMLEARHADNCLILNKPVHTDQLLSLAIKAIEKGVLTDA